MKIRVATQKDLPRLLAIYATARAFMAAHGNPHQWADRCWPSEQQVTADIASGRLHVCEHASYPVACFYYDFGPAAEPTYARIDGSWRRADPYGVVHRMASDGTVPGAGTACLEWAWRESRHLRIDTHEDNLPMRRLLARLGFSHRGTIRLADGSSRLAYDRVD